VVKNITHIGRHSGSFRDVHPWPPQSDFLFVFNNFKPLHGDLFPFSLVLSLSVLPAKRCFRHWFSVLVDVCFLLFQCRH